jgi:hypothetical protein
MQNMACHGSDQFKPTCVKEKQSGGINLNSLEGAVDTYQKEQYQSLLGKLHNQHMQQQEQVNKLSTRRRQVV